MPNFKIRHFNFAAVIFCSISGFVLQHHICLVCVLQKKCSTAAWRSGSAKMDCRFLTPHLTIRKWKSSSTRGSAPWTRENCTQTRARCATPRFIYFVLYTILSLHPLSCGIAPRGHSRVHYPEINFQPDTPNPVVTLWVVDLADPKNKGTPRDLKPPSALDDE